jgi:hypothetical protein
MKEVRPSRRQRVNRSRPGTIRLWTLHEIAVWEVLQHHGQLYVNPDLRKLDMDFQEPYAWMRGQMARRLPVYRGHDPWWAYDYPPDLRQHRHLAGEPGTRQVRLELAVPREEVLLSAYGGWHFVLGGSYLPPSADPDEHRQQSEAWERETSHLASEQRNPLSLEPFRTRILRSWDRIFDVEDLRATNTIEATFECLRLADVVSVVEFTVAGARRSR